MSPESYDAHKSERVSQLEELLSVHQTELSEARKEQDRLRGMLEVAGGNTTLLEEDEDDTKSSMKVKQSAKELLQANEALQQGELGCHPRASSALKVFGCPQSYKNFKMPTLSSTRT